MLTITIRCSNVSKLLFFIFLQVKKITTTVVQRPRTKSDFYLYDYILIGLSLAAILGYLIYVLIAKKKAFSLPDKLMISLLISLFGALICFAFVTTPSGRDMVGCKVLAALTQFFFLSSLTWSNSMAISIVRKVHTLQRSSKSNTPFILYSLYSFGLPFICTVVTFILSKLQIQAFTENVYEVEVICFLGETIIIYSLFLAPAYILIITNFIIGITLMVKVSRSGRIGASQDKNRLKKNIITCFKVSACLGFSWAWLFVTTFYEDLFPVMQVFIELQGLLIVVANLLSWKCLNSVKSLSIAGVSYKSENSSSTPSGVQRTEMTNFSTSQRIEYASSSDLSVT